MTENPCRRVRVTLSTRTQNELLLKVLSPIYHIMETFPVDMVITMDFMTFAKFMEAISKLEVAVSIKSLNIQLIDKKKDVVRYNIHHGFTHEED